MPSAMIAINFGSLVHYAALINIKNKTPQKNYKKNL